jgi:Protein of unknown function (DUF2970)
VIAALKTVLSGLVGIRRKAEAERQRIRPLQLIGAAVILLALFVFALIAIVRIVAG